MTDTRSSTGSKQVWPTEDQIWESIRLTFDEKTADRLSFKRWKDGIDVDYPSDAAVLFAKQMFAMGVASAAQAENDRGNLATGERENEETDRAYFEPTQGGDKGEAVAYRVYCTNNGATGYLYTEVLPFEPGPGVHVRREPEPLYAAPQPASNAGGEAVAWLYEMAFYIKPADENPLRDWKQVVTITPPPALPPGGVRNVEPLYRASAYPPMVSKHLLDGRDDFIVSKGLWSEFTSSLPSTQNSPPVFCGSLPSGESDLPVTADYAGGEAEIAAAKAFLREKPSTSYLQRKMQITYNHALRLMTALENEGFISISDSQGRRTVLLPSTQSKTAEG